MNCCSHSCSNAITWGLGPWLTEQAGEDAHIEIASFKNSSDSLHLLLDIFLQKHVRFRAAQADANIVLSFWTAFDVAPSFMNLVVEVDPLWCDGGLYVNPCLVEDVELWSKVTTCISYCSRWVNWSDTRWVKVGRCARLFVRSMAIGIPGLAAVAHQDDFFLQRAPWRL